MLCINLEYLHLFFQKHRCCAANFSNELLLRYVFFPHFLVFQHYYISAHSNLLDSPPAFCHLSHGEPELTFCQDGGSPVWLAEALGTPQEGDASAPEPAGGGNQKQSQRPQSSAGNKYKHQPLPLKGLRWNYKLLPDIHCLLMRCILITYRK